MHGTGNTLRRATALALLLTAAAGIVGPFAEHWLESSESHCLTGPLSLTTPVPSDHCSLCEGTYSTSFFGAPRAGPWLNVRLLGPSTPAGPAAALPYGLPSPAAPRAPPRGGSSSFPMA